MADTIVSVELSEYDVEVSRVAEEAVNEMCLDTVVDIVAVELSEYKVEVS